MPISDKWKKEKEKEKLKKRDEKKLN